MSYRTKLASVDDHTYVGGHFPPVTMVILVCTRTATVTIRLVLRSAVIESAQKWRGLLSAAKTTTVKIVKVKVFLKSLCTTLVRLNYWFSC